MIDHLSKKFCLKSDKKILVMKNKCVCTDNCKWTDVDVTFYPGFKINYTFNIQLWSVL